MAKIRVLNEETINKIAAGEVIENPASVVKELVDNAIDAGATEIQVEIREGGRQLIRVTDNGSGMGSDDALLCLERHATSKIRSVEEIFLTGTMGFRGEAIPSIASISKFTLLTRLQGSEEREGTLIIVEGGKLLRSAPAACAAGTTIEVKSLFFNIPVRRKFQKSPTYDTQEIIKLITTLALGHPSIQFRLTEASKTLLATSLCSTTHPFQIQLAERIKSLLGLSFYEGLIPVNSQSEALAIQGYIGLPSHHRPNRTGQFIYVNRRPIYLAPLISNAVRDGYGTMLPAQRYPLFVLHLNLPGDLVDANVHPQKREVRLRQEHSLKDFLRQAINQALQSHTQPVGFLLDPVLQPTDLPVAKKESFHPSFSMPVELSRPSSSPAYHFSLPLPRVEDLTPLLDRSSTPIKESHVAPPSQPYVQQELPLPPKKELKVPELVATLPQYLIVRGHGLGDAAELEEIFYLVDQTAAQARIIFEQLLRQKSSASQGLLLPYTLTVRAEEADLLLEQLSYLQEIGFSMHPAGPTSFLIEAIPQAFGNVSIEVFFKDLVSLFHEQSAKEVISEKMAIGLATLAAKAAIIKQRLSFEEGRQLLERLFQSAMPFYCPQGQSIFAPIRPHDLKQFFLSMVKQKEPLL